MLAHFIKTCDFDLSMWMCRCVGVQGYYDFFVPLDLQVWHHFLSLCLTSFLSLLLSSRGFSFLLLESMLVLNGYIFDRVYFG